MHPNHIRQSTDCWEKWKSMNAAFSPQWWRQCLTEIRSLFCYGAWKCSEALFNNQYITKPTMQVDASPNYASCTVVTIIRRITRLLLLWPVIIIYLHLGSKWYVIAHKIITHLTASGPTRGEEAELFCHTVPSRLHALCCDTRCCGRPDAQPVPVSSALVEPTNPVHFCASVQQQYMCVKSETRPIHARARHQVVWHQLYHQTLNPAASGTLIDN